MKAIYIRQFGPNIDFKHHFLKVSIVKSVTWINFLLSD